MDHNGIITINHSYRATIYDAIKEVLKTVNHQHGEI